MSELTVGPGLVGRHVCCPTRPEWGRGLVLHVQAASVGGRPVHRVSVQFSTGHRTIVVPPGRLVWPCDDSLPEFGWLDRITGRSVEGRLAALPPEVREFLGTAAQRFDLLSMLYRWSGESDDLVAWARGQTGIADPLARWSRDELAAAFAEFARRRDEALREAAAAVRRQGGEEAVAAALAAVPPELAPAMRAALGINAGR